MAIHGRINRNVVDGRCGCRACRRAPPLIAVARGPPPSGERLERTRACRHENPSRVSTSPPPFPLRRDGDARAARDGVPDLVTPRDHTVARGASQISAVLKEPGRRDIPHRIIVRSRDQIPEYVAEMVGVESRFHGRGRRNQGLELVESRIVSGPCRCLRAVGIAGSRKIRPIAQHRL